VRNHYVKILLNRDFLLLTINKLPLEKSPYHSHLFNLQDDTYFVTHFTYCFSQLLIVSGVLRKQPKVSSLFQQLSEVQAEYQWHCNQIC